jgi:hypothetical protein
MERRAALRDLIAAMDSDRYLALLESLATAALDPPLASPPPPPAALDATPAAAADPASGPVAREDGPVSEDIAALDTAVVALDPAALEPVAEGEPAAGPVASEAVVAATSPFNGGRWGTPWRLTAALDVEPAPASVWAPASPEAPAPSPEAPTDAGEPASGLGEPSPAPPSWAGIDGDERAADALPRLVRQPWRRLRRAINELGTDPPDLELHEVRIRAKRVRYAAEAVAVVVGSPATRLAKDAAALQEVLGDHHDAVVAEEWLRQASRAAKGPSALVAGQLIAGERADQRLGRDEWWEPAKRVMDKQHQALFGGRRRR